MTDTVTVKLSKPISFNGETIAELTFREATVGDARRADEVEGEFSKKVAIVAGMAGVSIEVIDRLPAREFERIMVEVDAVLSPGESSAAAGSTQ